MTLTFSIFFFQVILYEGVEGTKQGELTDPSCKGNAHDGGVFGLCWSPDDNYIATASGDKTVKVWNVATREPHKTIRFENTVENQQLSIIWTKCGLFSVSLAGFIHCLNLESASVAKTLKGHNKPITALTLSADKSIAFTADFEGNITRWELSSGDSERVSPLIHKSQVSGLAISAQGQLVSVGWDDSIAFSDNVFGAVGLLLLFVHICVRHFADAMHPEKVKLSSQPRGVSMSSDGRTVAVACQKAVLLFVNQKPTLTHNTSFEVSCISLSGDGRCVAVGGQDSKLRVFEVNGSQLVQKKELGHSGALTSTAWSPDGSHLVATDTARRVVPYSVEKGFAVASDKEWTFHTARVNCCAWSDDGRFVATGGLDTNVIVWDMMNTGEHPIIIRGEFIILLILANHSGAHSMSPVNGVAWLGPRKILSAGQDSVLKTWVLNV
ncbi:unnamed protein product [Toxocara canis]|uniref:Uncharacterized protein n=1 Tax=Toxocara canis TaxID=6265 RepID=A0A3P7FPM6_TOXCA|nr:unnamed protein product [Toxocara canis]